MGVSLRAIENLFNDRSFSRELESVKTLKNQLVDAGFASDEVEYMVREHTGKKSLGELNANELAKLKEALRVQLDIARKCLDLT